MRADNRYSKGGSRPISGEMTGPVADPHAETAPAPQPDLAPAPHAETAPALTPAPHPETTHADTGPPSGEQRHPPRRVIDPAHRFAFVVIVLAAAFAAVIAHSGGFHLLAHPPAAYLVYVALVVAGELFVLRFPSRNDDLLLSASSMFAYAAAIRYGPGPAMVALSSAAVVKGFTDRRPPMKTAFNAAQHALTVGLAGLVYQHLGGSTGLVTTGEIPGAVAGALAYLGVNYVLTGTVVALATGAGIFRHLIEGLGVWLPVEGVMLGFSPVVPIVAEHSLLLVPLLLLPFLGVFYSARIALGAEHAAMHDALTGLPNRVLFRARVEQALTLAQHTRQSIVVMVLDLDSFKDVNDTLGHGRGDELLRSISERLRRALRQADLIARLGGDEFGVLVSTDKSQSVSPEVLAERISDALRTPFELCDLWLNVGASIGIARSPDDGTDAEKLIQRADVAMYLAKSAGSGYERYHTDRDPNRPDNLRLLQELREGVGRGELVLHFQPKVSVHDGRVIGAEALVRWNHPTRGLLMPADFIELAERSEVVRSLTLCVVREAARQCVQWRDAGLTFPVAVKISPRSLLDVTLPNDIALALDEEGLPPELLEVEVTESCLISDPDRTADVLGRLNETGVRISIDDFGTGYSSLALLKRLPVDTIKIDRSFVTNLATDLDDQVIVQSTVKLAVGLGLEAVAEGVEDREAWQLLERYGCAQAQGFHVCRPMPAGDLLAWLECHPERIGHTPAL